MSEAETLAGLLVGLLGGILLALSIPKTSKLVRRSPFVTATAAAGALGFLVTVLFGVVAATRYWKGSPEWVPSPVPVASRDLTAGEPIERTMIASLDAPRWAASWVPETPQTIEGHSPSIPIAKGSPLFSAYLAPRDPEFCAWLRAPQAPQPEPEPRSNSPAEETFLERNGSRFNH